MNCRNPRMPHLIALWVSTSLLGILALAGPVLSQTPEPFPCNGAAFIVQRDPGELFRFFNNNPDVFAFEEVGASIGIPDGQCDMTEACNLMVEVNSMGFRKTDGLLYAVQLNGGGNDGIIMIDEEATVFGPVVPVDVGNGAWPSNVRFDAGDVSPDGDRMYISQRGQNMLVVLDLTPIDMGGDPVVLGTPTIMPTMGGIVNDWAHHPSDGFLYGGNRETGQVARVNVSGFMPGAPMPFPTQVMREDLNIAPCAGPPPSPPFPAGAECTITPGIATGLPTSVAATGAFGGAWFDANGNFFVYRNSCADAPGGFVVCPEDDPADNPDRGKVYQIDLTLAQVVRTRIGRFSEGNNDSTACIPMPPFIGAAKEMTATTPGPPSTVTITYAFENFGDPMEPLDTLTDLSAIDNLTTVFGMPGTDWTLDPMDTTSSVSDFHNPNFNGSTDTQLINQMPTQTLAGGQVVTITVTLQLLTLNDDNETPPGSGTFEFCNQIEVEAVNSDGVLIGDLSFGGVDPMNPDSDPDGNGIPSEDDPSCFEITGNPDIVITKIGALDDGGNGQADAGDVINYTFEVENIGNVPLTDVLVTDDMVAMITCPSGNPIPLMNPGDIEICTGSYVVTQADVDNGEKCNLATATGTDPTGGMVSDTDDHCEPLLPEPGILILKTGALNPGGDGNPSVGDIIDYVFEVTNTGNVTLTNVAVVDNMVQTIVCPSGNPIPSMAPGDIESCTGIYVVTQDDLDNGEKCNTVTATGTPPTGPPVTDSDDHCEPLVVFEIPTLGHLGLLLLALGLAGAGAARLRRRR